MINIRIARQKILNDMQVEVRNIIYQDDVKNAQERDEVVAYFQQAMQLNKEWDIFDAGEYEDNFEIEQLRINPEYKSQRMVEVNHKRRIARHEGKPYSEVDF